MSKVFDGARGLVGEAANESTVFGFCDRVQVDYGTSGVTSVDIYARLHRTMEWVKQVDTIAVTNESEMYIVPEMPFHKLVFTGGNGTQVARAVNIAGGTE